MTQWNHLEQADSSKSVVYGLSGDCRWACMDFCQLFSVWKLSFKPTSIHCEDSSLVTQILQKLDNSPTTENCGPVFLYAHAHCRVDSGSGLLQTARLHRFSYNLYSRYFLFVCFYIQLWDSVTDEKTTDDSLNWCSSGVGSISWLVRRGRGRATTCELYAKIIAESELPQPSLNEIHKFCLQHWSRGRGTCGTGSGAPEIQGSLFSGSLMQLVSITKVNLS